MPLLLGGGVRHLRARHRPGRLHGQRPGPGLSRLGDHVLLHHLDTRGVLVAVRAQRGRRLLVRLRGGPPPARGPRSPTLLRPGALAERRRLPGSGRIAVIVTIAVAALVAYLAVTRRRRPGPARPDGLAEGSGNDAGRARPPRLSMISGVGKGTVRIRRWVMGKRKKVVWSEPQLPPFIKINPDSPPGLVDGLQPGGTPIHGRRGGGVPQPARRRGRGRGRTGASGIRPGPRSAQLRPDGLQREPDVLDRVAA